MNLYLKRSNSTQLRKQPNCQYSRISVNKNVMKQKLYTDLSQTPSKDKMAQQTKMKNKLNGDSVHPHRLSYTQFDTEQQIQQNNKNDTNFTMS